VNHEVDTREQVPRAVQACHELLAWLIPLERRCGIPIGNLTSQFFANLYLNGLDHGIKETLRVPAYLRYVDDSVLLDDDKGRLLAWRDWIAEWLATL
jgi:hypothetical protein